MKTLTTQQVVDVLLDTARRSVEDSSATHPQDILWAMVAAIEGAAATLEALRRRELLEWAR